MADSDQSPSELTFDSPEEERDHWKMKAMEYRTKYVEKMWCSYNVS